LFDRFSSLSHYQARLKNREIDSKTHNCARAGPVLGRLNINLVVDGSTLTFCLNFALPAGRWIRHFIANKDIPNFRFQIQIMPRLIS
jgi:flagellar biosynthesis/type III secretory pathway M-ring protein FliF/YscJ